ncbi:ribonuclease Z [Hymenobacter properus]|uniref:Ribonuclease Z n=1 Tax=Hymenobacter properus TaxID=2791026 RepID=A0A931BMV1_9BACT|nr:ribonuclease Z [Hymenobacter properus]MBF9144221.1 ribonuclease Z [Hymenobacter properus]MBR7723039.1 ribonuclease Z [Microvirga sp. SRT04]
MTFELKILGSASATPTAGRHPTAQVLTVGAISYLIDCGEGAQWQMLEYRVRPHHLRAVFISHLHGDHYFGLFGLLGTMHLQGRTAPLTVVGPPGLDEVLVTQARVSNMQLGFVMEFIPVDTEAHAVVYEDELITVASLPMRHRIPCAGYLFAEKPRRANLLKEKLPPGLTPAQLARLAQGEDLPADDQHPAVRHADVSAPAPAPRRYAFFSDTLYTPALADFIQGADLLYHEATFLEELRERAAQTHHSTARQAATMAVAGGVKRLLIGHFSSRYKTLGPLLEEAQAVYPTAELATEGLTVNL